MTDLERLLSASLEIARLKREASLRAEAIAALKDTLALREEEIALLKARLRVSDIKMRRSGEDKERYRSDMIGAGRGRLLEP
jgi:hypothetical protein